MAGDGAARARDDWDSKVAFMADHGLSSASWDGVTGALLAAARDPSTTSPSTVTSTQHEQKPRESEQVRRRRVLLASGPRLVGRAVSDE